MKKPGIAATAVLLLLAGCSPAAQPVSGGNPGASSGGTTSQQTTEPAEPLDLAGTWKQTNSKAADSWQQAVIKGDTIEVNWISDNGDAKSLYWAGTFVAPTATGVTYEWDSKNDHAKTDGALLAATGETKTFSFSGGVLSWEVSMMGTTTKVKAERS